MVYESDFYTTRRPYRATPSVSSYTVTTVVPSRQIRILPGIGKVHVVHSYDRLIPYIGHKRLTVVSAPSHGYRLRPSVIIREIDRITHKARPYVYYSPTSTYLNSEPITFFDDETRLIRAQTASLLRKIHAPVPRVHASSWPLAKIRYYYDLPLPIRVTSDDYIQRMLTPIKSVKQDIYRISHYCTEPIRRYMGPSHLACLRYSGDKAYSRRRNLTLQEIYSMQSDTVRNDIQLLSYYIKANKDRKALEGSVKAPKLDSLRPTRVFSKQQMMSESTTEELKELREQRAERLRKIHEIEDTPADVGAKIKRSTKKQEEERLAEERALAEEKARKEEQAKKKEEEARRAELARQEALAAQAAAERQAEIERKAELAKQEELARKAEAEKAEQARIEEEKRKQAEEQARIEEEKRQAEEKARLEEEQRKAEEERQQLLRLEEIARQAEEEKERELARQAEELAELARQEAELAEQARKEAELAELAKQEAELAELERQEKELAELDRKDREDAEAAKQDAEQAEQETQEAEVAALESNIPAEEESSGPEPAASEEEAVTSEPEAVTSPEPEPVVEEPQTPEAPADPTSGEEEVEEEEE